MATLQGQYSPETLNQLQGQGIAKPFRVDPRAAQAAGVGFLNEVYADRIDIDYMEVRDGIPVRVQVFVNKTDGVPWKWTFTFNETLAKQNGTLLDSGKIKALGEQFSLPGNKILVDGLSSGGYSLWGSNDSLLQVAILNYPPQNVLDFIEAVFAEAVSQVGSMSESDETETKEVRQNFKVLHNKSIISQEQAEQRLRQEGIIVRGRTDPYPSRKGREGSAIIIEATSEEIGELFSKHPAWMLIEDTIFITN